MVLKIFKRGKDQSQNPFHKWEKQVKSSKRIRKDQMDRFISSSDMKANLPSYCEPSYLEERLEYTLTECDQTNITNRNNVDGKDNKTTFHDSNETRQVDNLDPTRTHEERFSISNQTDEYYPSQADSYEFEYEFQPVDVRNSARYGSRLNNPSEDGKTLGPDGAAMYLYNELLANPVLTCMTLPILPCLGIYVKKIQSDATRSKSLQCEGLDDNGRAVFSLSQDDDESPIYSSFGSTSHDDGSLDAEPFSPYAPGITNYSIGSPSIDNDWFGSGEENCGYEDYMDQHHATPVGLAQEMQPEHSNTLMHRDGSSKRRGKFWKR